MAMWQLIAHEYRKRVFTPGFFLFLLIIPVFALFGAGASFIGERAAPVRSFTVIDQTGRYGDEVDRVLADRRTDQAIEAWDDFVEALELTAPEPFDLPAPYATTDDITPARREAWREAGGLDAANAVLAPRAPIGFRPLEEPRWTIRRVEPPADVPLDAPPDVMADALRPYLNGDRLLPGTQDELFAALVIPATFDTVQTVDGEPQRIGAQYWSQNLTSSELPNALRSALTVALQRTAFAERGLDPAAVREVDAIRAPFDRFKSDSATGESVSVGEQLLVFVPLFLAYALLVMIMSVGGMLLTSTVEEKSNKIVEVLLSSVSATELMVGKLISLALVGLTAPAVFLLLGAVATAIGLSALPPTGGGAELVRGLRDVFFGSPLLPLFFFYFIVGYLLFASIYLAVGAMSDSIQDAQSFVGPLTIVLIAPVPILIKAIEDPNGIIMRILTWIPLYTPYAVMMRINNDPPLWEMIGATIMLVAFTGLIFAFMGRIYRNGVLRSGGAPKLSEAMRLARAPSA